MNISKAPMSLRLKVYFQNKQNSETIVVFPPAGLHNVKVIKGMYGSATCFFKKWHTKIRNQAAVHLVQKQMETEFMVMVCLYKSKS